MLQNLNQNVTESQHGENPTAMSPEEANPGSNTAEMLQHREQYNNTAESTTPRAVHR